MKITASSLPRLARCRGSLVMQHVDEPNEFGDRGTAAHRWFEQIPRLLWSGMSLDDAKAEASRLVPDAPPEMQDMDLGRLEGFLRDAAPEVALAWDANIGFARVLGYGMTRDEYLAKLGPDDIGGIVDAVAHGGDWAAIVDYKTGRSGAPDDWQQQFYAMAVASAYGVDRVTTAIVRTWGDTPSIHLHEWDALELAAARRAFEVLLDRIGEDVASWDPQRPKLEVGNHCTYCPSRRVCPALTTALQEVAGTDIAPLTPSEVGEVYRKLEAAEKVVARLKADIKRLAEATPIPLPDGKVLRLVERQGRPKVDGAAVYRTLETSTIAGLADIAAPAERKGAIKYIDAAARKVAEFSGNSIAEEKRRLMDILERDGAIVRSVEERVAEVKE